MPAQKKTCRKCFVEFTLLPGKPGNVNDCPNCSEETEQPVMAKVMWDGKSMQIIEITKDKKEVERFNNTIEVD